MKPVPPTRRVHVCIFTKKVNAKKDVHCLQPTRGAIPILTLNVSNIPPRCTRSSPLGRPTSPSRHGRPGKRRRLSNEDEVQSADLTGGRVISGGGEEENLVEVEVRGAARLRRLRFWGGGTGISPMLGKGEGLEGGWGSGGLVEAAT
jgi:hypothetical protein